MVSVNYKEFRKYSDKSLPEAKEYIAKFLKAKLQVIKTEKYISMIKASDVYNDTINAIDLFIDLPCYFPKIKVSHRARKMHGDIIDITIKTKSQNPEIKSEYDKLLNFASGNTNPWYYFYCFYDEDKGDISKYIIYDLRVLIKLPEFKDKSIFAYKDDKFNTKDGGSYFNCITVNKLIEKGVVVADWSKGEGEVKYYI
jgi:hypothetical protein